MESLAKHPNLGKLSPEQSMLQNVKDESYFCAELELMAVINSSPLDDRLKCLQKYGEMTLDLLLKSVAECSSDEWETWAMLTMIFKNAVWTTTLSKRAVKAKGVLIKLVDLITVI